MIFSKPLKKNEDFRLVYRKGASAGDRQLVLYVNDNGTEENRIGISVSKKVGNSVVRHRLKRRLREIYRHRENQLVRGKDLVIIVRTGAAESDYHELEQSFCRLSRKLKAGDFS